MFHLPRSARTSAVSASLLVLAAVGASGGTATSTGVALPEPLRDRLPRSEAAAPARAPAPDPVRPPADHHVHLWSHEARDVLMRAQEAVGQEVISEEQARVLSAADVVAGLDSAGIERGVVLSTAYFFGVPDLEVEDERSKVRAENDYVARQVAARPDRLTAFFSVNPLADYALDEIDRLADHEAFVGLKLHLGNSHVDLRNGDHVARLREVFRRAEEHGLAVVIHLGGRSDEFGAPDAEVFLDEVLPAAADVPIQVAHMGGPGGFGPGTRASARAFAAALEDHPERTRNLVFDLSAVPHPTYLARGDSALERRIGELNRAFVEAARELGFDRIVFGSDYPAIPTGRYLEGIREALPMSDEAFRDLVDDPAPYLR